MTTSIHPYYKKFVSFDLQMTLRILLIIPIVFLIYDVLGQNRYSIVQFVPEKPTIDQPLTLIYNSGFNKILSHEKIHCLAYFTGVNEHIIGEKLFFPKVIEVSLEKAGESWKGKIDSIPAKAKGLIAIFFDNLDHMDNNNGEGYWTPFYLNDKIQPGTFSSIAEMYAGEWPPESSFNLGKKIDTARKLFEEDFKISPELKRKYIRWYLETLDLNKEEDRLIFKSNLDVYSQYPDLDEWDLLNGISKNFARINDTISSEKYKKLLFDLFPKGSWATQTNSLGLLIDIGTQASFEKQKSIYKKFKEIYSQPFPDEFTRRVMESRRGQMLSYMVKAYASEGLIDVWLKELNTFDDEFKVYAYQRATWELLGINDRKKNHKPTKQMTQPEHPFLNYTLEGQQDKNVKIAESLSRQATEWWKQNLNTPRRLIDLPFYTENQILNFREERLGDFLDLLGVSLLRQNKFEEARLILNEAVTRSKYKEVSINEHYIECLAKLGRIDEALKEIVTLINIGKSSDTIDKFYFQYKNNGALLFDSLKDELRVLIEKKLKSKMIKEASPDFTLYNLQGNEISSSQYKNKVIVLDFWASWCPPCIEELKNLEKAVKRYSKDQGIVFLLLNIDKEKNRALRLIESKLNKDFFYFDPSNKVVNKFKVTGLPTKIIIDKNGNVRFRTEGMSSFNEQEQYYELLAMIRLSTK